MIGLLLKNPYVLLFGVLAIVGVVGGYTAFIYQKGKSTAQAACEAQKSEAINENIKIKKKQDSIPRPDTVDYIKRLRDGAA
jgi:Na+-translocating ferredoxin:NAD+ oxidoreductase RnfG subunit